MIQRIQTLFLFAALALMVTILLLPFAEVVGSDGEIYIFNSSGMTLTGVEGETQILNAIPLSILIVVLGTLLLVTIFLFRNRRLQMRFCTYAIILEFGLIGLGYYYFFLAFRDIEVSYYSFSLPIIIPVLSIILIYLAYRGIRKDDILIRSVDKIR